MRRAVKLRLFARDPVLAAIADGIALAPAAFIFPDGSIHFTRRGATSFDDATTIDRLCRWESIDVGRLRSIDRPSRVCSACLAVVRDALNRARQLELPMGAP